MPLVFEDPEEILDTAAPSAVEGDDYTHDRLPQYEVPPKADPLEALPVTVDQRVV